MRAWQEHVRSDATYALPFTLEDSTYAHVNRATEHDYSQPDRTYATDVSAAVAEAHLADRGAVGQGRVAGSVELLDVLSLQSLEPGERYARDCAAA